ncbi:MAG TPA: helix-turn-helix transcriptional regulator [Symbiobacteriaceae bacterium]|nr:helix-turn-helix transcriptional regulator [Symbiobacteriaceae bacterium]
MRTSMSELGRFSDPSLLILCSLASGPKHGYAMIQDIQAFSGTLLEPGTLYGALTRLESRGWIEPEPAEERRRPYRLTASGAEALKEQVATLDQIAQTGRRRLGLS